MRKWQKIENREDAEAYFASKPSSPVKYLELFWSQFNIVDCKLCRRVCNGKCSEPEKKLSLLRNFSAFNAKRPEYAVRKEKRGKFNKHFHKDLAKKSNCFVCQEQAVDRHHIVEIQNGGTNHYLNIIPLCRGCHRKIHSWL